MSLSDIDWKERARIFCRANDEMNVALIEKAMRDGAAEALHCATQQLSVVRLELESKRIKANAPQ